MLVKGFPFSVVYRASDNELLVVAIAPHRKQPYYWTSRIR
jgi:toxin ParE1/3/4